MGVSLPEDTRSLKFSGQGGSQMLLLLKVWSTNRQHQPWYYLGACQKYKISGPTPNLLAQSLHFKMISVEFTCTLKVEKH